MPGLRLAATGAREVREEFLSFASTGSRARISVFSCSVFSKSPTLPVCRRETAGGFAKVRHLEGW
jgi:hypothetical protein